MVRPINRSHSRVGAFAVLAVVLANARAGPVEPDGPPAPGDPWPAGRPMAVEVRAGRASFDLPASSDGSKTLVIVSALARSRGPFPIRMVARPVDRARPIATASRATARRPRPGASEVPPAPPPVSGLPPARRTFYLLAKGGDAGSASNYRPVEGRLTAVGRRVQVYVDADDIGAVDAATLTDLVATFDDRIYPVAASRFGPAVDVDRDGRFTVLFSSWLTRIAGGKSGVDGFVRGADLDSTVGEPFGNRCDMMYLSTSMRPGPHLRTIIAHEYTHAIIFSRKALAGGRVGPEEEGWLDEGLAHLVEDALGFSRSNIDYRVSAFLSRPERYRLVVDDYYTADLFRSHGNRGATYLFLRWCVDRYGPTLLDSLIRSERRGVDNLESATGSTFADLFRRWTVALYLSGLDPSTPPEEGYRSIDPRGTLDDWVLAGPRASTLAPGDPGESWSSEATTAHYALIQGRSTVEVIGPPEADLQVTAVPMPGPSARADLRVRSSTGPDGSARIRAEVVERGGTPVRLGALAWEPLVPPDDPRAQASRRGGLDGPGIASAFGTSTLPAGGALRSRAIRLPRVRAGDGPIVFKAVGTDARGRRVAAWAEVEPQPLPDALAIEDLENP